jgi:hypothetical protein
MEICFLAGVAGEVLSIVYRPMSSGEGEGREAQAARDPHKVSPRAVAILVQDRLVWLGRLLNL